jgi:N6-adenosine-specific RNA methylase IME4
MSVELVPSADASLSLAQATFSRTGLDLDPGMSYDDWAEVGETLEKISGAWQWWYGDWWNFGDSRYGEKHAQALPEKDYGTKSNAAAVAGRIEFPRRRGNLSFGHHVVVAYLDSPDDQDYWLETAITEELTVAQLRKAVKQWQKKPTPPLPDGVYDLLYVDPPWRYDFAESPDRREVENHYPTMDLDEIKALELPAADDAILFMWTTSPKLAEAFEVLEAWEFEYRTCMVWVKDRIGMGYYARQRHELLLIAKRGSLPVPDEANRPDSVIEAPRGVHSAKPEQVYELLEAMYPDASRVEMFARSLRPGWESWGNEV